MCSCASEANGTSQSGRQTAGHRPWAPQDPGVLKTGQEGQSRLGIQQGHPPVLRTLCQPRPLSGSPPLSGAPAQPQAGPGRVVGVQREQVIGTCSRAFVPGRTSPLVTATPAGTPWVGTGRVSFMCLQVNQFPE